MRFIKDNKGLWSGAIILTITLMAASFLIDVNLGFPFGREPLGIILINPIFFIIIGAIMLTTSLFIMKWLNSLQKKIMPTNKKKIFPYEHIDIWHTTPYSSIQYAS